MAPAVTAVGAALLTGLLVFTPLRFAYRSPELRVSLETAQALIAALGALLLYGRHRRSGLWGDFLAAYALLLFSATSLVFVLIPALMEANPGGTLDRFDTRAPLIARSLAAAALTWAALARRRWYRIRRSAEAIVVAVSATLGVIGLVVTLALDWLPPVVAHPFEEEAGLPDLSAPGALLVAQIVLVVLFTVAAMGFSRQAERNRNPLVTALACGCVLAAFARVNFFLYPSIYTDVVHVGDVLRLLFFLVLLVGAAVEITGFWRIEAEAAATHERQRMARELHDGLAQELAFIRSHTTAMARGASPPGVTPLVAEAAERAMAESRRVVEALQSNGSASLQQFLTDAAGDVAWPAGLQVSVMVDGGVWLPTSAYADVGGLVRRATMRAIRLRAASNVWVRLEVVDRHPVLAVEDDGTAAGSDEAGQGEIDRHADAVGATMRTLTSDAGRTRVEFVLPWRAPRSGGRS